MKRTAPGNAGPRNEAYARRGGYTDRQASSVIVQRTCRFVMPRHPGLCAKLADRRSAADDVGIWTPWKSRSICLTDAAKAGKGSTGVGCRESDFSYSDPSTGVASYPAMLRRQVDEGLAGAAKAMILLRTVRCM